MLNLSRLETLPARYARIWPKPFIKRSNNDEVTRQLWFVGLQFKDDLGDISGQALEMTRCEFGHYCYSAVVTFCCPLSRCLQHFKDMLSKQASSFHSEDMVIDAHYVHKSDLTGQLSEEEVN